MVLQDLKFFINGRMGSALRVAAHDSVIRNNLINNPTDGGIILSGSPGDHVENNSLWVEMVHFIRLRSRK